jgi:hypothetical protein
MILRQFDLSMMIAVGLAGAVVAAVILYGCTSPAERAKQESLQRELRRGQAAEQAQEKANQRAKVERVRQNCSKLREGMTFDEVNQLIGPFVDSTRELASFTQKVEKAGVPTSETYSISAGAYTCTVKFNGGKLKSWTNQ